MSAFDMDGIKPSLSHEIKWFRGLNLATIAVDTGLTVGATVLFFLWLAEQADLFAWTFVAETILLFASYPIRSLKEGYQELISLCIKLDRIEESIERRKLET